MEETMSKWRYTKGLKDIGNGVWAYLLPDGSWGWSNAGLIVDGDQTLLVDTLFDLKLTAEMLAEMRRSVPAAAHINTLFNTHHNGDHTFGIAGRRSGDRRYQSDVRRNGSHAPRALSLDDGER
jgi:cyclase